MERIDELRFLFKLSTGELPITNISEIELWVDDRLICADVKINGVTITYLWWDSLGFLEYWDESPRALHDLKSSLTHEIHREIIETIDDSEEDIEGYNELEKIVGEFIKGN